MKRIIILFISIISIAYAQQTQIIAHRGAWKNTKVPQNSIAALQKAIEQQAWGSEFDVQLTKDDVLVVNHDNDYQGIDIATSTYQELLAKKLPNGEKIPTAEEYLIEGLKQNKTKLIFELKSSRLGIERTEKAAELSIQLVKKLKAQKHVEFIAFSYEGCLKLRALDKKAKVHYLSGNKTPQELKAQKLSGFDYNFGKIKENPNWVKEAKALGLKTNVWTVNKKEDMQYILDLKVDYITTDEPELLKTMIK